jgi:hypothetical protein
MAHYHLPLRYKEEVEVGMRVIGMMVVGTMEEGISMVATMETCRLSDMGSTNKTTSSQTSMAGRVTTSRINKVVRAITSRINKTLALIISDSRANRLVQLKDTGKDTGKDMDRDMGRDTGFLLDSINLLPLRQVAA